MRLYMAVTTEMARMAVDQGIGSLARPRFDINTGKPWENVEMRDLPPGGLTFSRTTEATTAADDDGNVHVTISGGPVLADDPGEYVLSIEVPDDIACEHFVVEEPGRRLHEERCGRMG